MAALSFIRSLLRLARVLSPDLAWRVGAGLGDAFGALPMRDQGRAREHLARAFPDAEPAWIARTARGCFRHTLAMALWSLATQHRDPRHLRRGIMVEGAEHIRAMARASRRGEGTFVYTGHLGNWELLARCYATVVPAAVIARRLRSPLADAVVQELRRSGGARVIYQDDDARDILRLLRSGTVVATLADQDIPALAGCFVPWFGHDAYTPSGPAALAVLARSAVQCVYLYRKAGRWVLHCGPRWPAVRSGNRDADIHFVTARSTSYLEQLVRAHPTQWVWWHKRWRTRPQSTTS